MEPERRRPGRRPGPRIRTIKPECWQDEKIGRLSDKARLLFVGLVTLADDEGRFRALPSVIAGHIFPYDEELTAAALRQLLEELEQQRLVLVYIVEDIAYGAFRNWRKHQVIDRATPSELPPPPDADTAARNGIGESSTSNRRASDERSPNARVPPRGRAHPAPVPGPDPSEEQQAPVARERSNTVDQDSPPSELPPDLADRLPDVLAVLQAVQHERGGNVPTVRGVGLVMAAFPRRDHVGVAHELRYWGETGNGRNRAVQDWARQYTAFLKQADEADPSTPSRIAALRPGSTPVANTGDLSRFSRIKPVETAAASHASAATHEAAAR